jgi:hypothetical protein
MGRPCFSGSRIGCRNHETASVPIVFGFVGPNVVLPKGGNPCHDGLLYDVSGIILTAMVSLEYCSVNVHVFIRENVDAAIFETHHGGEYDATNVIQKPIVTGITSNTIGTEAVSWFRHPILDPEKQGLPMLQRSIA